MLNKIFLFLLAPFNALTPLKSSAPDQLGLEVEYTSTDQLAVQLPNSPTVEDVAPATSPQPSCMIKQLYQWQDKSDHVRLENLAVRANGQLILDSVTDSTIYGFDPRQPSRKPRPLHTFKNVRSVLGIDEITHDVFAVVVGNFSDPGHHQPGSFSLWSLDMNQCPPNVTLITKIPHAIALNGLATLKGKEPMVLIADSVDGVLWRVDPRTRDHEPIYSSPLLANITATGMGVNGIRIFERKLYFINSGQETYGRIHLHHDARTHGEVELLGRQKIGIWDDFDIDWAGNAWVATHRGQVTEITVEGRQRNMTLCEGFSMLDPTSARFGRGSKKEENTLYIVTAGNKGVGGAQVLAADVCQM